MTQQSSNTRHIVWRTQGHQGGPITRLMSPSDLGKMIKPFVFLDLFDTGTSSVDALSGMPIHPHSEPYRVCRRVNILRDYPDDKIKIYP